LKSTIETKALETTAMKVLAKEPRLALLLLLQFAKVGEKVFLSEY
jgi:hypothetical protein